MISSETERSGGKGGIWDILNEQVKTTPDSEEDVLGLLNLEGIEIWQDTEAGQLPAFHQQELSESNIEEWISRPRDSGGEPRQKLRAKILLSDQVISGDSLRPFREAFAIRFSRSHLAQNFQFPPTAIYQLSAHGRWHFNFSNWLAPSQTYCEGVGTSSHSFIMSKSSEQDCIFAFVVFYSPGWGTARKSLVSTLRQTSHLEITPALLAYAVGNVTVKVSTEWFDRKGPAIRKIHVDLQRFATQRGADEMFGHAHLLTASLGGLDHDLRTTLSLVTAQSASLLERLADPGAAAGNRVETARRDTKGALDHCAQELRMLQEEARNAQNETARQLTTSLNMMMYTQQQLTRQDQQTGIDIAEASKAIAEETKKDGSSMKTLAVVTMCFLPATSVSSVLAMPLFNWDTRSGNVVNNKLWIFFVLAIPLTLMTIGIWYVWQRTVMRRRQATPIEAKA